MALMRERRTWLAALALMAALALALAACGGDEPPATVETQPTPTATATPVSTPTATTAATATLTPASAPTPTPPLPPTPLTMTLCRDNIRALQEFAWVRTDAVPEGGPCLVTISEGSETELILEWVGGSSDATKWQYRQRKWYTGPQGAWTDIPGSGANTVSHRVAGLEADTTYYYEVRAWIGNEPAVESNEARGATPTREYAGLPMMRLGQVSEGGRSWVLGGSVIVDIPLGIRVMHSFGALSGGTVVFTMSEIESMSAQVFDLETGKSAGRVIEGTGPASASDMNTLFDQILASARLVPPSTPAPTATPTATSTTFRYDKLDTTGAATAPGSYAFLRNAGDAASAIGNFGYSAERGVELRIHPTDAARTSRATLYDTVKIGDSFDYQTGPECAFRFKVTSVSTSATPRIFGIELVTIYGGWCEGFVDNPGAARDVSFVWRPGAGYAGPDGVRVLLFGEPTGEGTYRLLTGSDWVLDIPAGIRIIVDGYWLLEPGEDDPPDAPRAVVPLIDEASGSRLLLDPIRGKEIERHISQQPDSSSSRDVNALFDQIVASMRMVPWPQEP